MKATLHTPTDAPGTLHTTRYLLEFKVPRACEAACRSVRLHAHGATHYIASAMDMYKVAEAAGEHGDVMHECVLEDVRGMRARASWDVDDREEAAELPLYPFQSTGALFLAFSRDALLADEMGLGKTVQALMALPAKAFGIVVAPRSVVHTWVREAHTWRPDLTFTACDREALGGVAPGEFLVATPDAVREHHKRRGLKRRTELAPVGSCCILDEAHLYKNQDAARTEAIGRLVTYYDVRWALTGTPLSNRPSDLWGTLDAIGLAMKMFKSHRQFDAIFGGYKDKRGEYTWAREVVDPVALRNAFRGRSLRRLRKDVAPEIPEKTYSIIHHEHPPVVTREERQAIGRFKAGSLDEKFGAPVAAVQRRLAESKIDVMFSTVDSFIESGDPLVVFSANVAPLGALASKYGCRLVVGSTPTDDRVEAIDDFQAGRTKLIGLQVQAGGVGITLTAAHHMLFVQRGFSKDQNDQAEDRICRIGQRDTCVIYDILSDHPLDRIIRGVLRSKAQLMASTVGEIPAESSHNA